jgi:ABC-type branched-subunit amino acid transport system substrate-binding protein
MAKQSAITLIDKGATVVIGPESAEIAPEILPVLREHNVALISPVVGASADSTVDCSEPWFRLAPSAQVLGRSLGKLVLQHGAKKIVILASTAAYDHALSVAAGQEFGKGGFVLATEIVDNQAQTYASIIANTLSANPDAIVVAATPEAAALIVNEYSTTVSKHAQWYFSPLLKTDLFIQNVDPNAIEGALGVAPEVWDTGSDFVDAYSAQWAGVAPLEGADYFYDAVSILGLALLKSNIGANGQVSFASFNQSFFGAAGPPGTWVSWNDIEEGMNKSRNGESVYYSGLTGPIVLDSCGARQIGSAGIWTVKNGSIVAAE